MTTKTKPASRYTEEQLKDAEARRAKGESYRAIGAALGIKATAYLSKVLKQREYERATAKASRGRKSTTKTEGRFAMRVTPSSCRPIPSTGSSPGTCHTSA